MNWLTNRVGGVLAVLLLTLSSGWLQAGEAWTVASYLAKEMPPVSRLPIAQPGWEFYAETKVATASSVTRVDQRQGKGAVIVSWITEGLAATLEPDGSLAISSRQDFDLPERPSLADIKGLSPVAAFAVGERQIQVFDLAAKGGMVTRLWMDQKTGRAVAQSLGRFVSLYMDDPAPSPLQLPPEIHASLKEQKRKRQKAAAIGAMPQ